MILAGIDEAGYGPRLGPLVVAGSAFRCAEGVPPDAWPRCWFPCGQDGLRVGDSKSLYSRSKGLASLERVVFGFAACRGIRFGSLAQLLKSCAVEGAPQALSQPWYAWRDLLLPHSIAAGDVDALAVAAANELAACGLECLWTHFCVVDESRYNELLLRTGNKALLLFGRNAVLMRHLWEASVSEEVWLTVDRHGGRKFYAGLLDIVFPDARIAVLKETEDESVYRLDGEAGRRMSVRFVVRAEDLDSSVALSSIWAKYVRELFMHLFNGYWLARADGLKPTAGYWVDGERFVADLRASGVVSDTEADRFIRWK